MDSKYTKEAEKIAFLAKFKVNYKERGVKAGGS